MQNLSSRLARLAVENKLCHSFQAFHSSYSDTGLLGIYFVTDKNNIEDMMHWSQNAWSVIVPVQNTHAGHKSQHVWVYLVVMHMLTLCHQCLAPCRMNLCTTVTESDVARGKNALKASLVGQLNGM